MTSAKEIMHHQKWILSPQETVAIAAEKMKEHNAGVIVVAEDDKLMGILTDRDIVIRCLAVGRDPKSTRVEKIMSSPVIHCMEDDPIENITKKMSNAQVHRLPVMDRHMKLCGLISLNNICAVNSEKGGEAVSQLVGN
jgi:CBS domain-containing protein